MKQHGASRKPRSTEERDLQAQADDLLAYDGWRKIVTDPPYLRGLGVSEKGIPDRLYIRYSNLKHALKPLAVANDPRIVSTAQVLWIEWKARAGVVSEKQKLWHAAERKRGAFVLVAGKDFAATLAGFKDWYARSGLNQRVLGIGPS